MTYIIYFEVFHFELKLHLMVKVDYPGIQPFKPMVKPESSLIGRFLHQNVSNDVRG